MILTIVCGFWFTQYLVCAGERLKGLKQQEKACKSQKKIARARRLEEMCLGS